ncbi:unnamed protein product [marine sediment metagenome]|uniref:Uncharacterized protein n=1 Tax=marine sediment metagenome TaxID=412755 RepID=X1L772_9ZZZZ
MFFSKKSEVKKGSLEEAKKLGLITEEEFLKLKMERAEVKLKNFLDDKKKKRK